MAQDGHIQIFLTLPTLGFLSCGTWGDQQWFYFHSHNDERSKQELPTQNQRRNNSHTSCVQFNQLDWNVASVLARLWKYWMRRDTSAFLVVKCRAGCLGNWFWCLFKSDSVPTHKTCKKTYRTDGQKGCLVLLLYWDKLWLELCQPIPDWWTNHMSEVANDIRLTLHGNQ